jgi:hypothetical protein
MNANDMLVNSLTMSDMILTTYLSDFTNDDMFVRAVPGTNHAAWQIGHLIGSEYDMLTKAGQTLPALPDGIADRHSRDTAGSDDPAQFSTKDEYLAMRKSQRDVTLGLVAAATESDFGKPTPEEMHIYAKTVGAAFNMIAIHEMMHAPQLIAIRRKLGKPTMI